MQVIVRAEIVSETLMRTNKNQEWLKDKLGISAGYLSDILSGNVSPSGKVRDKMQKALNIKDWDWLFKLKEI